MSTLSIRLPEALFLQAKELARTEGISLSEFVLLALTEKMSGLSSSTSDKEKSSREKFETALSQVRDIEPLEHDRIEE